MTIMRVTAAHGHVLTYDTDDVENIEISTPADIRELPGDPGTWVKRELTGDHHLHLHIDFKHGKKAVWVDQADAMLPDLRMGGEILRAALAYEHIPAEVASRVWNRFFFGHPDGLNAAPMSPAEVDELRAQQRADILDAFEIPQELREAWGGGS